MNFVVKYNINDKANYFGTEKEVTIIGYEVTSSFVRYICIGEEIDKIYYLYDNQLEVKNDSYNIGFTVDI